MKERLARYAAEKKRKAKIAADKKKKDDAMKARRHAKIIAK